MVHTLRLDNYSPTPRKLVLGTNSSFGTESIQIERGAGWDGLALTATWHIPGREEPLRVALLDGDAMDVPPEVTKEAKDGVLVLAGLAEGVQRASCNVEYLILEQAGVYGGTDAEPTPELAEQVLQAVQDARDAAKDADKSATDAKDIAQRVRTDADNGKFNGKDGAKGDKGDDGTTPQLKIGEDNLWHVSYDNGATWVSLGVKATGDTGAAGKDGADGVTPHIGENGNWWIGNTDTGVSAKGKKGDVGPQGPPGEIPEDYPQIRKDVSQLKEDTAALQKRQNVLVGSETGNPVSCNDAFAAPLCGLTVYGKSTQNGTPSPDNPVPIVSAGDGGSITMKVTGKNLYHAAWTGNYSKSGLLLTATSTTIAIKGTATKETFITRWLIPRANPIPLDPNKRYTFTPKLTGNVYEGVMVYTYDEKGVGNYTASNIPARSTGVSIYYQKNFKKDETIDFEASIQLEIGTEATVYEPYREQLLTLPTPNGLPGIPVTSGGNYTDPQGQQWVCDEVDLERGVKVQRVGKAEIENVHVSSDPKWFDANKSYSYEITDFTLIFLDTSQATEPCSRFIMSRFPSFYNQGIETGGLGGQGYAVFNISKTFGICTTAEEFKTWFNENAVLYKILATPIETPLTPAEIAAYKALTAYGPDTVVQAGDGAGVRLEYQRDVNIAIKKLEDAIASMTTT